MNIMQIAGLATTSRGWQRMQAMNLSIPVLAWTLVVPLSLLPAMLLYYAGTHYGDDFIQGFSARNWHFISTTFFLTELLSFFPHYGMVDPFRSGRAQAEHQLP